MELIPHQSTIRDECKEALEGLDCIVRVLIDVLIFGKTIADHDTNVLKFPERCRKRRSD